MFAFSQAFRRLIYDDSMIAQFTHDINTVASLQLRYVNVFIDFLFLTACDLFFVCMKTDDTNKTMSIDVNAMKHSV